ncbi:MAG: calcium-binding protein [Desulfotignum sp.]|nr:calcium-binding protein [Desulfotignum sp.]
MIPMEIHYLQINCPILKCVEGSIHDDTLKGNDANNWLWGMMADDTLIGSSGGWDILYGGQGNDSLDGGTLKEDIHGPMPVIRMDRGEGQGITANMVYDGNECCQSFCRLYRHRWMGRYRYPDKYYQDNRICL